MDFTRPAVLSDVTELRPVNSGSFVEWKPLSLQPELIAIGIATLLLLIVSVYFYVRVKNVKPNESLTGFALLIEMFVSWTRTLVADVMGVKFVRLTPYFLYLFLYIATTNLTSLLGFEPAATAYSVPLSMGLVTFFGIFVVGIRYQRLAFFNKYMIFVRHKGKVWFAMVNPLEIVGQITPLISISFRLWGNITAGSIILTLFYGLTAYITSYIPIIGAFNFLGGAIGPFLHAFFDLLEGIIQAFVFTLLTLTYWGMAAENADGNVVKAIEQAKSEQMAPSAATKAAMVT